MGPRLNSSLSPYTTPSSPAKSLHSLMHSKGQFRLMEAAGAQPYSRNLTPINIVGLICRWPPLAPWRRWPFPCPCCPWGSRPRLPWRSLRSTSRSEGSRESPLRRKDLNTWQHVRMKSKHEKRNCKQNKISEIHSILMKCPEVLKKFITVYSGWKDVLRVLDIHLQEFAPALRLHLNLVPHPVERLNMSFPTNTTSYTLIWLMHTRHNYMPKWEIIR